MRFRLVKTGKTYGEAKDDTTVPVIDQTVEVARKGVVPPIIWETGNKDQLLSTLVLNEAELIRLKSQLTGNAYWDWYTLNGIRLLEAHIATIQRWLKESGG